MVFYSLDSPVAIIVGLISLVILIWLIIVSIEVYGAAVAARQYFERENYKAREHYQALAGEDREVARARREGQRADVNLYRDR